MIVVAPTGSHGLVDVCIVAEDADEHVLMAEYLPQVTMQEFWAIAWRRPNDTVSMGVRLLDD